VNVPIVPIGLNYFKGHRFRGRVVVEYGAPVLITKEIMDAYHKSKRDAYQMLLHEVEKGMRSVIVTATDYNELKLIHTVRRLFQRSSTDTPTKEKQQIARRLSGKDDMLVSSFSLLCVLFSLFDGYSPVMFPGFFVTR
jgi:glycerol-3-phosphate O-acyltransferase/dihydroxyacetone phosphate acyltransferase